MAISSHTVSLSASRLSDTVSSDQNTPVNVPTKAQERFSDFLKSFERQQAQQASHAATKTHASTAAQQGAREEASDKVRTLTARTAPQRAVAGGNSARSAVGLAPSPQSASSAGSPSSASASGSMASPGPDNVPVASARGQGSVPDPAAQLQAAALISPQPRSAVNASQSVVTDPAVGGPEVSPADDRGTAPQNASSSLPVMASTARAPVTDPASQAADGSSGVFTSTASVRTPNVETTPTSAVNVTMEPIDSSKFEDAVDEAQTAPPEAEGADVSDVRDEHGSVIVAVDGNGQDARTTVAQKLDDGTVVTMDLMTSAEGSIHVAIASDNAALTRQMQAQSAEMAAVTQLPWLMPTVSPTLPEVAVTRAPKATISITTRRTEAIGNGQDLALSASRRSAQREAGEGVALSLLDLHV